MENQEQQKTDSECIALALEKLVRLHVAEVAELVAHFGRVGKQLGAVPARAVIELARRSANRFDRLHERTT